MAKIYSLAIFFLLFTFSPFVVHAASLSIIPATGSFSVGDAVSVKIIVTSNNVPFNAVSGTVSFPPSIFSIESVSKVGSVLNFWVTDPAISKTTGTVKFEGVALGGFTGLTGTVLTVNLRADSAGAGTASFESGQILANDGQGTDITGNLDSATFNVNEKEILPKNTIPLVPKTAPAPTASSLPIAEEPAQPAPSLNPPEISIGTKYGALAIVGTSDYPQAQTLITFMAEDGVKIFILSTTETDGSFDVLVPSSLKRGNYIVTSVMIKADKTNSDVSNTITIDVGNVFSDIGWQTELLIALLVLAILYLLLRIHFHFMANDNKDRGFDKGKLQDAEKVIHKSFDILREDVTEYGSEKLTAAEHKHLAEIKKDISDAEKIIDKNVKDI